VRWSIGFAVGLLAIGALAIYSLPSLGLRTPHTLTPEEEFQTLEKRVQQYWQARAKEDLGAAFQFEDPVRQKRLGVNGYSRSLGRALRIESVDVLGVTICPGGELADVRLRLQYETWVLGPKPIRNTTERTDNWQKLDGMWYHVLDFRPVKTERPVIQGTNPDLICAQG
jgi:hypothetical protein